MEYCTFHSKDDDNDTPNTAAEKAAFDAQFVEMDRATAITVLLAANYMDVRGMVKLMCKAIADTIRGKTPEQVRLMYNLDPKDSDFTDEEKAEIEEYRMRSNNYEYE